jgi:hypothetical protein
MPAHREFAMQHTLSLDAINSPEGEIANTLARWEHGERWANLTAEEMLATYNRWRALIELDEGGYTNEGQRELIARARSEWQRALWNSMAPNASDNPPDNVGFV